MHRLSIGSGKNKLVPGGRTLQLPTSQINYEFSRNLDIAEGPQPKSDGMCPNRPPTVCGILVEVADRQVVRMHDHPANPESRGFLCIRGRASGEIIEGPARMREQVYSLHDDLSAAQRFRGSGYRAALWNAANSSSRAGSRVPQDDRSRRLATDPADGGQNRRARPARTRVRIFSLPRDAG